MPAKPAPLVFLHIPKTAGSSLINELGSIYAPCLSVEAVWRHDLQRHDPDNATILKSHRDRLAAGKYAFVHGHFTRRELIAALGDIPLRLVTWVREPVARIVSEYFYVTSPAHPTSADLLAAYPTLEHFVEECLPVRNSMHSYLMRADEESAEGTVESLDDFAFVGRVEHYDEDFQILARLLNNDLAPSLHYNRGAKPPRLTKRLRRRIEEFNAADALIYSAASNRATAAREAIPTAHFQP